MSTIIELQKMFIEEFSESGKSLTHLAAKLALKKGRINEFSKMVYDQMDNHKFPPFTDQQNTDFLKLFKRS